MNPSEKVKTILDKLTIPLCKDDPFGQGGKKIKFDGSCVDLRTVTFQGFVNRISTFKPEDWSSDPNAAIFLSKYGFKAVSGCKVRCCSCGIEVDVGVFLRKRDVLRTIAVQSHKQYCKWLHVSTQEEYFCIPRNPHRSLQDLKVTFTEMMTFQTSIPLIVKDNWVKMGISEAFMMSVLTFLEQTYSDIIASCVVLSLCGWVKRNEKSLQCNFCQRVVGVWNFISDNVQSSCTPVVRPSKHSRVISLLYSEIKRSMELSEDSEVVEMNCDETPDPTAEHPSEEPRSMESPSVGPPSMETSSVEPPSMETSSVEPPSMETSSVKTPSAVTPSAETPSAVTPSAVTPSAETPSAETLSVETPSAETLSAETPSDEPPSVESPPVERPAVERPPVECPVEPPSVEPPSVEPPSVEPPSVEPPFEELPDIVYEGTTKRDQGGITGPGSVPKNQLIFGEPKIPPCYLNMLSKHDLDLAKRMREKAIHGEEYTWSRVCEKYLTKKNSYRVWIQPGRSSQTESPRSKKLKPYLQKARARAIGCLNKRKKESTNSVNTKINVNKTNSSELPVCGDTGNVYGARRDFYGDERDVYGDGGDAYGFGRDVYSIRREVYGSEMHGIGCAVHGVECEACGIGREVYEVGNENYEVGREAPGVGAEARGVGGEVPGVEREAREVEREAREVKREARGVEREAHGVEREAHGVEREAHGVERGAHGVEREVREVGREALRDGRVAYNDEADVYEDEGEGYGEEEGYEEEEWYGEEEDWYGEEEEWYGEEEGYGEEEEEGYGEEEAEEGYGDGDIHDAETETEADYARKEPSDISSNSVSDKTKKHSVFKSNNNGASREENDLYSTEPNVREETCSQSIKSVSSSLEQGTIVISSKSEMRSSNNSCLSVDEKSVSRDSVAEKKSSPSLQTEHKPRMKCVVQLKKLDPNVICNACNISTAQLKQSENSCVPANRHDESCGNSDGRRKRKRVPENERNGSPHDSGLLPRLPSQMEPAHFTRSKKKELEMMLNERSKSAQVPPKKDNVAEVIEILSSEGEAASEGESKNHSQEQEDNDKDSDTVNDNTGVTKGLENDPTIPSEYEDDTVLNPVICSIVGNAEIRDTSGPIIVSAESIFEEEYIEGEGRKYTNGCRTKSHIYNDVSDNDSPIVSSPEKSGSGNTGRSYEASEDTSAAEDSEESPRPKRRRILTDGDSDGVNSVPELDDFVNDLPPTYFHPELEHRYWCIWRIHVAECMKECCGWKKGWELYMAAIQKGLELQSAKKIAVSEVENNALGCLADIVSLTNMRRK